MLAQFWRSFVSIGTTSPPAMSFTDALPDADTPSYCPVRIRVTISSEVLATLTFVWQPVAFSNGLTQSTFGSVEPSSQYPAQQMTERCPSPGPTDDFTGTFGTVKAAAPDVELLLLLLPPHADSVTAVASTVTRTSNVLLLIRVPPLGQIKRVSRVPLQAHPVAPLIKRVLRRSLEVLADRDEASTRVEVDQEPGDHAQVDDLADPSGLGIDAVARRARPGRDVHSLGPHAEP